MSVKSKENLLVLKLEHPLCEESMVKYIDFPSDYILRKRLGLADDEVSTIRQAYGYFQDTVAGAGGPFEKGSGLAGGSRR